MALDAATLALTAAELKTTLADAKIAKLFEPTRDELVITLRTRTETDSLLLSARSGSARVCLTEESFENPETPPSFCMLMRKHLTGGRLLDVRMEPGDRIVYFEFQCTNEMGDLVRNILCAELMGRYSNLVLVQNGKIIDALKRVDFEDSDVRQLLPGLPYTTPPKPARPDFLAVSSASIVAAACQRDLPVADALNKTVAGVGPVVCREAAWRAFDGEHLLANELTEAQKVRLMAAIDELKEIYDVGGCPCSVTAPDGKPVEYTFFRPRQYGEKYRIKEWPSFNAMLEGYYAEKDRAERLRTKSKELHKAVHNMYERAVRKQAARQEELAASGKSEKLRLYGELLSANLYLAEKGMKSITVPNWYDEGKEVTIPLDLRFSPSQNAQNFFKNYKKKQTAARMLVDLLAEGEKEIAYLETVLYEVETASGEAALNEIRAELKSQGYLKYYKQRDKRQKPADFLRFTSSDGFEILVGRNNAQNDKLTLHTARGKDLWFHVQKAPGSHVVVMSRGEDIPDTTRQEAAELAVVYSSTFKAGAAAKVAVDTTEVKNMLRKLCDDERNTVVINSGRDHRTLDKWLGDLPLSFAAEHGAFYKENGVWHENVEPQAWDERLMNILREFEDKTPNSRLEVKATAVAWHYRKVDNWIGMFRAQQLMHALIPICSQNNLQIMRGNKIVEVKPTEYSKGSEVQRILNQRSYDFILAIGDDVTDEDMFRALPEKAVTIKVGYACDDARYNLLGQKDVLPFLNNLLS